MRRRESVMMNKSEWCTKDKRETKLEADAIHGGPL